MNQALTNAIEAINSAVTLQADESTLLIAVKCRGLIVGYDARWKDSDLSPLSVEAVVTSDLFNPETQRKSRSFMTAGKIDVQARRAGKRIVVDHKSVHPSTDIADFNSPYWRQLVVESQPSLYMLLEHLNGCKVDEAVWDVMKKPGINPKKLTKAERAGIVSTKKYCGRAITHDTLADLQTEERENLELFEARLAYDCTVERPEWYFQRRTIPRLDAEIYEFAQEFWDNGQEILHARRMNRWPRNSGACMLYGSPCKFLGICSGHDTPDSDHWQRKQFVHNELADSQLTGDGRDVLTNSRIRCFQTCRKKHFYEYELGIERHDEDEKEALVFGTLWHLGLNAWWSTFIQESSNVNGANGFSVNAIGNTARHDSAASYAG